MAQAVCEALPGRIDDGCLLLKYGHRGEADLPPLTIREAGHPEPDENGMAGAERLAGLLKAAGPDDTVLVLISGGGSALYTLPAAGVSFADIQTVNRRLLGCGADIHEINTVRKHLSAVKGGRSAELAFPAKWLEFVLSDVIGDDPSTIASGPFAPDPTTFDRAARVLERYGLGETAPAGIRRHLAAGTRGDVAETPDEASHLFRQGRRFFCGNNTMALRAAAARAEELGFSAVVFPEPITGEVERAAPRLFREAADSSLRRKRPVCFLSGGETTVNLGATFGKGGRNMELALSFAVQIENREGVCGLFAGTDGTDGPTDAAGAVVDGGTLRRADEAGLDAKHALLAHDAYPFFRSLGDLVITGPTRTNVMDLQVIIFT